MPEFPNASAAFRRLNPGFFGGLAPTMPTARGNRAEAPEMALAAMPREERPRKALNKTEARALDVLLAEFPEARIISQPTRFFPLAGGGTYTPDFLVLRPGAAPLAVEVKGGYRGAGAEQGYDRYKRAALEWAHYCAFEMRTWDRARAEWKIKRWDGN